MRSAIQTMGLGFRAECFGCSPNLWDPGFEPRIYTPPALQNFLSTNGNGESDVLIGAVSNVFGQNRACPEVASQTPNPNPKT